MSRDLVAASTRSLADEIDALARLLR